MPVRNEGTARNQPLWNRGRDMKCACAGDVLTTYQSQVYTCARGESAAKPKPSDKNWHMYQFWYTMSMSEPGDHEPIGRDFDDFLRDEGILDDAEAVAAKRVIAFQIAREMESAQISQAELARRMKTSRSAVERLLDPTNPSVTLQTLERAASAVGKRLRIQLTT